MLQEHLGYVSDPVRREQFRRAISLVVKHGDRVVDLGCGSGVLALLALQQPTAHVYAIDASAMIDIARESIALAGVSERVTFIRRRSQQVDLPERVDVVMCDHVGYFGYDYDIIECLGDARRRLLKPGGTLIPSRIRLNVAAVGSPKCCEMANGWQAESVPPEFHWLHSYSVNAKHAVELQRDDVLGPPVVLGDIDLYADNPEYCSWNAELSIDREGVMNGLAGWFDCELAEDVWMTNSPLAEQAIRRPQAFLPIGEAVHVRGGDVVKAAVMVRPADDLIAWVVECPATGQRFSHSTWQGMPLSPEQLTRARPDHVPQLSREGQARMVVLGYCDGRRTVQDVGQAVVRDHPDLFPSSKEISTFVLRVLGRDTE